MRQPGTMSDPAPDISPLRRVLSSALLTDWVHYLRS